MNPHPPNDLDYYRILGVAPDASLAEIKRTYRALARRFHPDLYALHPDLAWQAEIVMSEINNAYAVLSHSQKRQQYDEQRRQTFYQAARAGPQAAEEGSFDPDNPDYDSLLFATSSGGQGCFTTLLQWLSLQRAAGSRKQWMGTLSKMLLTPVPFCAAIIVSALFWQLGKINGSQFLGGLSAVLAYPLILGPMLLRLWLPIRYRPLFSLRHKIIAIPVILIVTTSLAWLWVIIADHNGTRMNPLDLYWWCGLIIATCVCLAYL